MRRLLLWLAAAAVLIGACGQGGGAGTTGGAAASSPSSAVDGGDQPSGRSGAGFLSFDAALVGGGTFEGASVAGKDLALWFWSPW